ncbi:hypothetical protein ACOBQX_07295 [Actinokineospora sp. G85]|uniref:hypothetical protein n=1 Tax=Actinokineospora sp. G85 TaxID=3406626 RepID=UPI003C791E2D
MSRSAEVARAFLLWLSKRSDQPTPESFLKEGGELVGGQQVGEAELESAVQRLVDMKLLNGKLTAWGRTMPLRSQLTGDGRRCVDDFDGDTDAWDRRHMPTIDQSVTVTAGRDAQVAAHAQNVNQVQNSTQVDVGKLAEWTRTAKESIPALGLTEEQAEEARQVSQEILAETEASVPDQSKLKTLGTRLLTILPLASAGGTLVKLLIDGIGGAFA